MPQFDFFSFFVQVFWLLIFFIIFYLLFLKCFLYKTSECLKFRNKLFSTFFLNSNLNKKTFLNSKIFLFSFQSKIFS